MEKIIKNSSISKENVLLYDSIRILNSKIYKNSVVGDFSRIIDSFLYGYNRVDRNSLIYFSKFDMYSYLGASSVIMHSDIGKFCSLSWGITIGPANHDYEYITSHDFLYNNFYDLMSKDDTPTYNRFNKRTKIGNDVWIGTNSTILNGLVIGDGAIIGANTIVTKDVPPYAIVVGNPGKIVKFRFNKEIIQQLLELRWWDLSHEDLKENYDIFKSKNINKIIEKLKNK